MSKNATPKKPSAKAQKAKTTPISGGVTKAVATAPAPAASLPAGINIATSEPAEPTEEVGDVYDPTFLAKRFTKASLKRLCFRGGCSRLGGPALYEYIRRLLVKRLVDDVRGVSAITNYLGLKTIQPEHAHYFYAQRGRPIYGNAEHQ